MNQIFEKQKFDNSENENWIIEKPKSKKFENQYFEKSQNSRTEI